MSKINDNELLENGTQATEILYRRRNKVFIS